MKRNLLVGNGINIQFGGPAYGSEFILKRIILVHFYKCLHILFE